LQLDHQERHNCRQRRVGFGAFLGRAAGLDAVAVGQRILGALETRLNLRAHVGRLHAIHDVRVCSQDLAVGAEDGAPTAALGVVSRSTGPWWSLRSGEIDARIEIDLRMRQSAEGGLAIDAAGRAIGMTVFRPRRRNSSPFSQLTERASFLAYAIEHPAFEERNAIDDAEDGARQHQLNPVFHDCLVHSVERRLYRTEAVAQASKGLPPGGAAPPRPLDAENGLLGSRTRQARRQRFSLPSRSGPHKWRGTP
jgi:hypothetical protein